MGNSAFLGGRSEREAGDFESPWAQCGALSCWPVEAAESQIHIAYCR